jgi:predicted acyl esterase
MLTTLAQAADTKEPDKRGEYIRSHFAKYEYQIPMRDGVKLFTSVYIPYDKSTKYPMLMQRTPYRVAPYGADKYKTKLGPSEIFEKDGFIFVFQDVRGKFMSEGEYVNMRPQDANDKGGKATDDATDTYDTIDWLVETRSK